MDATLETIKIVSTPGILGGKPRIAGHRISVELIGVWHDLYQWDIDKIARELPTITHTEIHAALSYYYAHRKEILARRDTDEERLRNSPDVIHITDEQLFDPNYKFVLTPADIAAEFGVTIDAVYQAVRRGSIRHRRSGATILIARWDAEKRWKVKSKRGRPRKKHAETR